MSAALEVPRFYTRAEMLAKVKVCYRTVLRWQESLGFPKPRELGPGTNVYLADQVDAWLIKRLSA